MQRRLPWGRGWSKGPCGMSSAGFRRAGSTSSISFAYFAGFASFACLTFVMTVFTLLGLMISSPSSLAHLPKRAPSISSKPKTFAQNEIFQWEISRLNWTLPEEPEFNVVSPPQPGSFTSSASFACLTYPAGRQPLRWQTSPHDLPSSSWPLLPEQSSDEEELTEASAAPQSSKTARPSTKGPELQVHGTSTLSTQLKAFPGSATGGSDAPVTSYALSFLGQGPHGAYFTGRLDLKDDTIPFYNFIRYSTPTTEWRAGHQTLDLSEVAMQGIRGDGVQFGLKTSPAAGLTSPAISLFALRTPFKGGPGEMPVMLGSKVSFPLFEKGFLACGWYNLTSPSFQNSAGVVEGGVNLGRGTDLVAQYATIKDHGRGSAKEDHAWRIKGTVMSRRLRLTAYLQDAGLDYVAEAAPLVTRDRRTLYVSSNYAFSDTLSFYTVINRYHTNVREDPAVPRFQFSQAILGGQWRISPTTSMTANHSRTQEFQSNPPGLTGFFPVDRMTSSTTVSLSQKIHQTTLLINAFSSHFSDRTGLAGDLATKSLNMGVIAPIGQHYLSTFYSISSSKAFPDQRTTLSRDLSTNINLRLFPPKVTTFFTVVFGSTGGNQPGLSPTFRQTYQAGLNYYLTPLQYMSFRQTRNQSHEQSRQIQDSTDLSYTVNF